MTARAALIAQCADRGMSMQETAEFVSITMSGVHHHAKRRGLTFRDGRHNRRETDIPAPLPPLPPHRITTCAPGLAHSAAVENAAMRAQWSVET